eukprot:4828339-Lingulodinium_polyedra.AAC.1
MSAERRPGVVARLVVMRSTGASTVRSCDVEPQPRVGSARPCAQATIKPMGPGAVPLRCNICA